MNSEIDRVRRGREGVRDRWGREGGRESEAGEGGREEGRGGREGGREREREREAGMTWLPHRCHVDSPYYPRQRDFFLEKKKFRLLCGHLKS